MNHLPSNLRLLRKQKGLTQQTLADALGLNRPVIGAYEEGRAEPKMETLIKICHLFGVPMERLLCGTMEDNKGAGQGLTSVDALPSSSRVLAITVDQQNKENIEWVPIKASAGYLNGFSDPEFMSGLVKFQLPMLSGGTLRAFEIHGDSMLPLTSGTFIIGEFVDDWRYIKEGITYIVISMQDGIVYKRVFKGEKETQLTLVSDNPIFQPYTVERSAILEIWKATAYISTKLPEPTTTHSLNQLGEMLINMQQSINQLHS